MNDLFPSVTKVEDRLKEAGELSAGESDEPVPLTLTRQLLRPFPTTVAALMILTGSIILIPTTRGQIKRENICDKTILGLSAQNYSTLLFIYIFRFFIKVLVEAG